MVAAHQGARGEAGNAAGDEAADHVGRAPPTAPRPAGSAAPHSCVARSYALRKGKTHVVFRAITGSFKPHSTSRGYLHEHPIKAA